MYSRMMSIFASSRALPSSLGLTPALARASISAHLLELERPGTESHFFRKASARALSGINLRRTSDFEGEDQGSWSSRISVWKCSFRMSRLRLKDQVSASLDEL